jgi:hypothetical protein
MTGTTLKENLLTGGVFQGKSEAFTDGSYYHDVENVEPNDRKDLLNRKFWQNPRWFENFMEILFKLKRNKVTFKEECYYGLVQFISCLYVLPVVPYQLKAAVNTFSRFK